LGVVVLIFASKSFPLLVKSNFGTPDAQDFMASVINASAASVPHRRSEVVLLHSSSPPPPEGWGTGGGGADDDDIIFYFVSILNFLFVLFSLGCVLLVCFFCWALDVGERWVEGIQGTGQIIRVHKLHLGVRNVTM
jgi:hypothetical protein